jgi:alkyl sulfatase BDS1-like metallo-beta-lactamase superfamily hydrolase
MFFDYLAVRLNPAKAEGKRIVINWNLPDTKQQARMNLENSALTYMLDKQAPNADVTVTLNRSTLDLITLRQKTFQQAAAESLAKLQGDGTKLQEVLGMLDEFNPMFDIVTPNPVAAASAARQ